MRASGLIINDLPLPVPGVTVVNFKDDPKITLPREDGGRRVKQEVTLIVLHSTLGAPDRTFPHPQTLIPGVGPSTDVGRALVDVWGTDHRCAGAHLAVDHDAKVYCLADLLKTMTYHATSVNPRSIGIEYRQGRKQSEFYGKQLSDGNVLVVFLAVYFGIQLMKPKGYKNRPNKRFVDGAKDFYGIIGHRDQSDNRGDGDPGDFIMNSIVRAESFDIDAMEDRDVWKKRQAWLGLSGSNLDGIPGPKTRTLMKGLGFVGGLWAFPPKNIQIPVSLRPISPM